MVSFDLFSKGASGNVPGPTFLPKVAATEKLHNAAGGVWWLNRLFRMTRTNQEVSPWNIQRRIAWPPADVHLAWPLRKDLRTDFHGSRKTRVPLAALGLPGITCWKPTGYEPKALTLWGSANFRHGCEAKKVLGGDR